MLLIGIPSSILGGIWADRAKKFLSTLWIPAALIVVLFGTDSSGKQHPAVGPPQCNWPLRHDVPVAGQCLPLEYPEQVSSKDCATALGLVLTLGNLGAVVFPYVYTLGAQLGSSDLGWWMIAGLSALSVLGIHMAREPRVPHVEGQTSNRSIAKNNRCLSLSGLTRQQIANRA